MKDYIRQYRLLNAANTGKEKPPSANLKNTPGVTQKRRCTSQ
ncbi:hypothetical protein [Endozoicomonas atrinae]|nr:hypothetical protein [Endozoicomonas atrinae]